MKRKSFILLSFTCLLSVFFLTGLLIYAFRLQSRNDIQDQQTALESEQSADTPDASQDTVVSEITAGNQTDPLPSSEEISEGPASESTPTVTPSISDNSEPIILAFAGDVNLDEGSKPVAKYDSADNDILSCLSEDLVEEMNSANVMMLNNEFSYSTRGTKAPNKSYTFRADPSRVTILKELGVDIVSLANNHALDYGQDALADTFETLEDADIDYVGAGKNLDRAKAPIYRNMGNKTIAFVAASRVVFAMDWYASETSPGMIGTYDPAIILESVKEAEANSDFVVVFVHWGIERNSYPEEYQRNLATQYIDAGADAVIGCHPHVMQGFEYYKGKPIAYSLGNYWFNSSTKESGLLKLYLNPDDTVKMQILPVKTKDTYTYLLTEEKERSDYFDFMEKLSFDLVIDKEGNVTEK